MGLTRAFTKVLFAMAHNPLYVMVYSDREEVHLWNWNVQVYALIGGNVIAV